MLRKVNQMSNITRVESFYGAGIGGADYPYCRGKYFRDRTCSICGRILPRSSMKVCNECVDKLRKKYSGKAEPPIPEKVQAAAETENV